MTATAETTDIQDLDDEPQGPLFSPDSVTARFIADWRTILLIPPAFILQASDPVIGAGTGDYSVLGKDAWNRLDRSYFPIAAMAILDEDEAREMGRNIRLRHRNIRGTDHKGRKYNAYDPTSYCLVLGSAYALGCEARKRFGPALSQEEHEELYDGIRQLLMLAGMNERHIPADLPAFWEWYDAVLTERLEDTPTAHEVVRIALRPPAPPHVPDLVWRPVQPLAGEVARVISIGLLPPHLREVLDLKWTWRDERKLDVLSLGIRAVDKVLPKPAREITRHIVLRRHEHYVGLMRRLAADGAKRAPAGGGLATAGSRAR